MGKFVKSYTLTFEKYDDKIYSKLRKVGDLMIYQNDIENLHNNIKEKIGQKIIIKGSLGRSRLFEKEATIEKAYPNIFVVKYDENKRDVSYQYKDVLTRTVEVDVFDGESYSSLVPPPIKKVRRRRVPKIEKESFVNNDIEEVDIVNANL